MFAAMSMVTCNMPRTHADLLLPAACLMTLLAHAQHHSAQQHVSRKEQCIGDHCMHAPQPT